MSSRHAITQGTIYIGSAGETAKGWLASTVATADSAAAKHRCREGGVRGA